jgi:hypothetical protein
VEGLEAFAEKKIEYGEMMDDHAEESRGPYEYDVQ